jgi:hypothetical protein
MAVWKASPPAFGLCTKKGGGLASSGHKQGLQKQRALTILQFAAFKFNAKGCAAIKKIFCFVLNLEAFVI